MTVVYFSAPWCGPCKMFKPVLQEVARNMGIAINDVNVDYDASYTQKYNITSVPTLIILNDQGDTLFRNSGVMSKDQLIKTFTKFK
jgi:thioredoxin 1